MTRSRDTANIIPTVDAKGDLIVGSADNTVTKLTVGAEGTVLLADPSTATGLAWGAAGGSISVSTTAPEDPAEGDLWFNSANATTYIYYDSFWVELSEAKLGPTGLPGVVIQDGQPTDSNVLWLDTDEESLAPVPAGGTSGQILAKSSATNYDTAWVNLPSGNAIINGGFDIWQRGTSFSTFGMTADRWGYGWTGGTGITGTVTRQTFTPGAAPVAGYEGQFFFRHTITNTGGASSVNLEQRIEDVRTFAGQTITVSFWAKADAARDFKINLIQEFGSGGSANVNSDGPTLTTTTDWVRYTRTVDLASVSGKTIAAGSYLTMRINPTAANYTFDIWGVQVEAGSTATAFRRNANSLQGELAACQRYFEAVEPFNVSGTAQSTSVGLFNCYLKVRKRTNPTISFRSTTYAFDRTGIDSKTGTGQNSVIAATDLCVWNVTGSSGLTIGNHLAWNGGNVEFSSEL
jgi:hypothetical protein